MTGKQVWVIALVVVIVVAGAAAVVWEHLQRQPAPLTPAVGLATGGPAPSATPTPGPAALPKPAGGKPAAEPLPPLIPGSPLTDEKFAAISAKIVIAAMGLKQDKNWEVNTLLYMSKVLDEAGIDESQFRDYAQALGRYPDRARAVAANIVGKAEKKLGYRISMDKMPMFNLSPERVKKIDKELQKKLK